jgi:hypothetical protein
MCVKADAAEAQNLSVSLDILELSQGFCDYTVWEEIAS